ncbi:MAG TPA: YbhB/YbcL family Raf kinase inhibitor-like protein [Desulfohalobiaceae bacterium]|nr:YbhB/YbcL family Raf kinase inhibitor-like protein [Desulfohalobiaceae bacterium]
MKVISPAFSEKDEIPKPYLMPGAEGSNLSIPLEWSEVPKGTQSFALAIIDPHPIANNWIHWLVINIPAETTSLSEGASSQNMPTGAKELQNSFGKIGYGGPQPPKGTGEHPYVITVYALNIDHLDLRDDASLKEFKEAIQDKVLDQAELTGVYEQE